MTTEATDSLVWKIGETAGKVWHVLNDHDKISVTRLVSEVDAPRDLVLQAIGWLAREEKIDICRLRSGRFVSLR